MNEAWDRRCGKATVFLMLAVWLGSTWCFGAWEQWWFWPFAGLVFAAAGCLGLRLAVGAVLGTPRLELSRLAGMLLVGYAPFLVYALVRAVQADVVMDAERSFLLHITPVMLALGAMIGIPADRQRRVSTILTVNLVLIGLYGLVNHHAFGNARVLWEPGFPAYQTGYYRATGTYYCPDHFAGLMEVGMGLALSFILSRSASRMERLAAAGAVAVCLLAILASKSRGAGAVTALLLATALWMGPSHLAASRRWLWRSAALAALAAAVALLALFGGTYTQRFREYPWRSLQQSERVQMSLAALRGWRSAPLVGIGPGMHQNLWPHIAASSDGDRAKGAWPTYLNNTFHSFEAHNDWVQLLEEYGAIGMSLFLLALGGPVLALIRARGRQVRRWREGAPEREPGADRLVLAAGFALLAMAVHSIGDFNLQIPATTWLLGGIVGLGLAAAARDAHRSRRKEAGPS